MPRWTTGLGGGTRYALDVAVSLLIWTVWLVLGVLFILQIGIAFSRELTVPDFVLRSLERQLNASGITPRFGHATFDPAGGILVENVDLSLREFEEPVANARAVYIQFDSWSLLTGTFETRELNVTGLKFFAPAMFAPSGRSEPIVEELDLTLRLQEGSIDVQHLTAKVAGVAVRARGSIHVPRKAAESAATPVPLLDSLARGYAGISRQLIRATAELSVFDHPRIEIELTASSTRAAIADVILTASHLSLPQFQNLRADEFSVTTRVPLVGDTPAMSQLAVTIGKLRVSDLATADDVQVRVRGPLNPGRLTFRATEVDFTITAAATRGFTIQKISGVVEPQLWPRLEARILAESLGSAFALEGRGDVTQKRAIVNFDGALSPALLDPIGALLKRDLHRYIGFGKPLLLDAEVTFKDGWKFERLAGQIDAREVNAYNVPIDRGHGEIEFDGRRFVARNAIARLGDNIATGSFEQDLKTLEFRFLLEGRLRPLAISGWFREWWPNFFQMFEFPVAPPDASVDVAGRWFAGRETTVFLFADSAGPTVRGVKFDQGRTLMFIRPHFIDGLETYGTRGTGELRGTFVRRVNPGTNEWSELTLALTSTLDLEAGAKLLGPILGLHLAPYSFEQAPRAKVSARFDGPGAINGSHQNLNIQAQSTGAFSAFGFPARNLSFDAKITDDKIVLENVKADVASGKLSGRAELSGDDPQRKLGFDAELRGASLAETVTAIVNYAALRRGEPQKTVDKILPGKTNVKLDLALSADGVFNDLYSFNGSGNAILEGAELGEVRLLGMLSELLNFTALRFTAARAEFKVMGPKVIFPAVSVTGSNSAIESHGEYSLRRRELDFNARVYPFQESKSLLQNVVGAVLTPLSAVLEVKLTGPLEQPNWAFVIGPTNFFRSLTQASEGTAEPASSLPTPYLKPSAAPADAKTH